MKTTVFWILTCAFMLVSCQSAPKKDVLGLEPSPEQRALYRAELEKAWSSLDREESEVAYKQFLDFQKKHPQTIFEVEAKFGEARALEQMGEWAFAGKIYREISVQRLNSHPGLAALAMYENSKVAEALGNESEMMASLMDAEKQSQYLPEEIRMAALPARQAIAELKVGQNDAARKSLQKAEKGLTLLKQKGVSPQIWARLYFEMGSVATNQLAPENFQAHLDSFNEGQIFLLKAIESGVLPWADRALSALQSHYRDFWNLAMNPPVNRALDQGAQERARADLQEKWLGQVSRLVVSLQQHQRPEGDVVSVQEKKMNEFLEEIEKEIETRLLSLQPVLPLTPEAQRRTRLKREGTVRSDPLFPSEKKKLEAPVPVKPDPNLQQGDKQ